MLWASRSKNPGWVKTITNSSEMYGACMKRIDDLCTRYKGRSAFIGQDFYTSYQLCNPESAPLSRLPSAVCHLSFEF